MHGADWPAVKTKYEVFLPHLTNGGDLYRVIGWMLSELAEQPELGLLRWERGLLRGPMVVQYWRSREHLDRFARGGLHVPAARDFNRRIRASADVGVWHEAYEVRAGAYESAYANMPLFGLAAAAQST